MGYAIDAVSSAGLNFKLNPENEEKIKKFLDHVDEVHADYYNRYKDPGAPKFDNPVKGIDDIPGKLEVLEQTLTRARSPFEIRIENGMVDIEYNYAYFGEYWREDRVFLMLDAFAPYAEKGAYIGFIGEDCEMFSYVFDGKGAYTLERPTINWLGEKAKEKELSLYDKLFSHAGHRVQIACYGERRNPSAVVLSDLDTDEVILDTRKHSLIASGR